MYALREIGVWWSKSVSYFSGEVGEKELLK